jgi:hypothetical protein
VPAARRLRAGAVLSEEAPTSPAAGLDEPVSAAVSPGAADPAALSRSSLELLKDGPSLTGTGGAPDWCWSGFALLVAITRSGNAALLLIRTQSADHFSLCVCKTGPIPGGHAWGSTPEICGERARPVPQLCRQSAESEIANEGPRGEGSNWQVLERSERSAHRRSASASDSVTSR